MVTYDFTLILSEPAELSEDLADKLFANGCDDATPSSCGGTVAIDFSREAVDLETAIRSAIANASEAGCLVDRVEIDADAQTSGNQKQYDQVVPRREFIQEHAWV